MTFQTQVNSQLSPAVAGDFASANPRASTLAGPGGLVAGPEGVTVGKFAWIDDDGRRVRSYGTGVKAPDGFVHRDQQGLITVYLGEASMNIPKGFPVTLFDEGDFWAVNSGPSACAPGDNVYATYADGSVTTGSAATGASATGSIGATFTATGTGTSLAVTSVTGRIVPGDTIAGVGVPVGTTIVSGPAAGGAGTYITSVATTAAAATVTSFGSALNVTAVASGVLAVGDPISGTGVPAGAVIASQVNGTAGGIGLYTIDIPASAYAASTALTVTAGVLTTFKVKSVANVGELVKISTWGN